MSEVLSLDLVGNQADVVIGGENYVLKEATGEVAKQYRNSALRSVRLGSTGKAETVIGDGLAIAEPLLVSLCLFKVKTLADNSVKHLPVKLDTVLSWPNRVIKPLFNKVKEISDLGESEETLKELRKEKQSIQDKIDEYVSKEETVKN